MNAIVRAHRNSDGRTNRWGDRLSGKVAVITGGTSGIGEATAELFASEGAKVVIAGRSRDKGAALADRLGENVVYEHQDVTVEADVRRVIDSAAERFGRLDVLFNNAGGPTAGNVMDITAENVDYGVKLLFTSVVLGMRYAVPHMLASGGGSIINNSSVAALRHLQGNILYSAVKAAVTHYSKLAGVDLGPQGIRVNVISPGAIATPIFWGGSARANTLPDEENARKMAKLQGNLGQGESTQEVGARVGYRNGGAVPRQRRGPVRELPRPRGRRRADVDVQRVSACALIAGQRHSVRLTRTGHRPSRSEARQFGATVHQAHCAAETRSTSPHSTSRQRRTVPYDLVRPDLVRDPYRRVGVVVCGLNVRRTGWRRAHERARTEVGHGQLHSRREVLGGGEGHPTERGSRTGVRTRFLRRRLRRCRRVQSSISPTNGTDSARRRKRNGPANSCGSRTSWHGLTKLRRTSSREASGWPNPR